MAYTPTNWKDRDVENPRTYTARQNEDGSITFFDAPGTITEAGTPVNAVNMNKIEEQLYKNDLERKITNCITEIPQDIKLELNNGTLTLKAGSKVYVPNGVNRFDVVVIDSDINTKYAWKPTSGTDQKIMVYVYTTATTLDFRTISTSFSGATKPTVGNYQWYDTTNNKVIRHDNVQTSFPIAIITQGGDGVTKSIDQVFNGFGYIGNTVFALPGVKGLIPNGRNADGSLRNIELNSNVVKTYTESSTGNRVLMLDSGGVSNFVTVTYDEEKNILYNSSNPQITRLICGTFTRGTNGVVSDFTTKLPFRAVDCNEADYVVESYNDGNNWYRVYKSGWLEQGGVVTATGQTKNLLKAFKNTNYSVAISINKYTGSAAMGADISKITKTTTSIKIGDTVNWNEIGFMWIACGQGA